MCWRWCEREMQPVTRADAPQSKARHIGTVLKVKESLDGETFGFISVIAVGKTRVRSVDRSLSSC